jgi:hypothetical protein
MYVLPFPFLLHSSAPPNSKESATSLAMPLSRPDRRAITPTAPCRQSPQLTSILDMSLVLALFPDLVS